MAPMGGYHAGPGGKAHLLILWILHPFICVLASGILTPQPKAAGRPPGVSLVAKLGLAVVRDPPPLERTSSGGLAMAQADIILATAPRSEPPKVRAIGLADLGRALRAGLDDFWAMPRHTIFLCLIYPIAGMALFWAIFGLNVIPLLFPMAAGFALIGPFAAIGLYELSRRRELGLDTSGDTPSTSSTLPPCRRSSRLACCCCSSSPRGWWRRRRSIPRISRSKSR
jgi:hypothetical protein